MDSFEVKCKSLLENGRDQDGKFADKKDRELSFYRRMYHYYKKYTNTIYSQAILDQLQLVKEIKEAKDAYISEKKHNKRLKKQIEILKNHANR